MIRPTRPSGLTVLAWNVYQGHDPADVRQAVATMARTYRPHVIVLNEATNAGPFGVPDYAAYQLPKNTPPGRIQPEDADTAILVRVDVDVRRHRVYRMKISWTGPDHGLLHEPRVFQAVWVRTGGRVWKLAGGHWPFGVAKDEAKRWTARWLRRTLRGRPVLFVGDLNESATGLTTTLRDARAKSVGHRIDRALYRNCHATSVRTLGEHGSDHHAVLYAFDAVVDPTPKEKAA